MTSNLISLNSICAAFIGNNALAKRNLIGALILPLYFLITLSIGWLSRRRKLSTNSYLNATRSMPVLVIAAAYLAANCGALEIVGLSALASEYGVQAFHFYCIGAIPAMVFLALIMMPLYRRSSVRSVPEYLEVRYGPGMRLFNACISALTAFFLAGISLYAMAQVLIVISGVRFLSGVVLSAVVVLVYVLLGGLRATIYNEVFQLFIMIFGLAPLAWRCYSTAWEIHRDGTDVASHLWTALPLSSHGAPFDVAGVTLGLGFVLSFGYWCTDFVLMQRAFAVRTEAEARIVPLLAGFGKLAFSFLVVVPGVAAIRLIPRLALAHHHDQALPLLMELSYGPILLGLGLTALVASLMSGLAANISAVAALWTEDIYRAHINVRDTEAHYMRVARIAIVTSVLLSCIVSYTTFLFSNLMENVQLLFALFSSPFWAVFLLGMTTTRVKSRAAIIGFLSGITVGLGHLLAQAAGWLHYGSVMSSDFHVAVYSFATALIIALLLSCGHNASAEVFAFIDPRHPPFRLQRQDLPVIVLSAALLLCCLGLNFLWR